MSTSPALEVRDGKRGWNVCPLCGRKLGEFHSTTCPQLYGKHGNHEVKAVQCKWFEEAL